MDHRNVFPGLETPFHMVLSQPQPAGRRHSFLPNKMAAVNLLLVCLDTHCELYTASNLTRETSNSLYFFRGSRICPPIPAWKPSGKDSPLWPESSIAGLSRGGCGCNPGIQVEIGSGNVLLGPQNPVSHGLFAPTVHSQAPPPFAQTKWPTQVYFRFCLDRHCECYTASNCTWKPSDSLYFFRGSRICPPIPAWKPWGKDSSQWPDISTGWCLGFTLTRTADAILHRISRVRCLIRCIFPGESKSGPR